MDENLIKYLPSMAELAFKRLIYSIFHLQKPQNAGI